MSVAVQYVPDVVGYEVHEVCMQEGCNVYEKPAEAKKTIMCDLGSWPFLELLASVFVHLEVYLRVRRLYENSGQLNKITDTIAISCCTLKCLIIR